MSTICVYSVAAYIMMINYNRGHFPYVMSQHSGGDTDEFFIIIIISIIFIIIVYISLEEGFSATKEEVIKLYYQCAQLFFILHDVL